MVKAVYRVVSTLLKDQNLKKEVYFLYKAVKGMRPPKTGAFSVMSNFLGLIFHLCIVSKVPDGL